jgi:hypothetical protein
MSASGRSLTLSLIYLFCVQHFRQFIDVLNERGVDMNKAKISKAEMALWGSENDTYS